MSNLIGQSLGRYYILEQLGEGGMATVYRAFDTHLERDVAVKVIRTGAFPPEQLEGILKRFEREAKALAGLTHPNIVGIIDYGEHAGSPFLVMPFLAGGTLNERLNKPMDWRVATRLLIPIAHALQYAHDQGIIHRDIKPSNILVTFSGEPMLSDFGIAKIIASEGSTALTGSGVGLGTPEYMSPEQWTGKVNEQSDLYSLGVVYYEMLTGRKPYCAETPAAIMLKQASEPLPRPSEYAHNLPEAVEKVLLKALAKEPDDRQAGMGELARALEELLVEIGTQATGETQTLRQGTNALTVTSIGKQALNNSSEGRRGSRWPTWLLIGAGIGLTGLCLILAVYLIGKGKNGTGPLAGLWIESATPSPSLQATTIIPATPTETYTLTRTYTPTLGIGSTWLRTKDGMTMMFVPPSSFQMGMDANAALELCRRFFANCSRNWFTNAEPVHTVRLQAYWIDQTEVSNRMYALCVDAGECNPPAYYSSYSRGSYYGNPDFDDYPVIYVDWGDAQDYCTWAGARLPTEAEWELAARGMEGYIYPWGNDDPGCELANLNAYGTNGCVGDTDRVDGFPAGRSPFGALGMAGNVFEWVADWFSATYYGQSPEENPQGPTAGSARGMRGGSWSFFLGNTGRSSDRNSNPPEASYNNIGFRCAMGAEK